MDGGGRSSNALNSGYSWSTFEEKAREHEPAATNQSHKSTQSPTTGRLSKEDMAIYGTEPAVDHLSLVVCTDCNRVVKSQALVKHKELYHTELHLSIPQRPSPLQTIGLVSGPSDGPTSTSSSSSANPILGSADSSSMASSNHGFLASGLPLRETGQKKKTTTRDYDPEHHCGVWCEGEGKHCLRSLTCKIHPTSQKAKVVGRSKPFGQLLELHRQKKELKKKVRDHQQPHPPGTSPLRSPNGNSQSSGVGAHSPITPATSASITDDWFGERGSTHTESRTCVQAEPLPGDVTYPRPLAVCPFNSRLVLGSTLFSRRLHNIHATLLSSMERRTNRKGRESSTRQRTKLRNYSCKHHHVTAKKAKVANSTSQTSSVASSTTTTSTTKGPAGLHRSVPLFGVKLKETRLPSHMIDHVTGHMASHRTDHTTGHMTGHMASQSVPQSSNAQVLSGREAPPIMIPGDMQPGGYMSPHQVVSEEGGREMRGQHHIKPSLGDGTSGYVDGISAVISNGPNHVGKYAIPKMHSINGMVIPASATPPPTTPPRVDSPQQFQLSHHLLHHRPPQSPQDGYPPHSLVNSLSPRISRLLPLAPSISSTCQSSSPHHSSQQQQQQQSAFNFGSSRPPTIPPSRPTPPPSPLTQQQQQLLAAGLSPQHGGSNPSPGLPGVFMLHQDQASRQQQYHAGQLSPHDQALSRQYILAAQQSHHQEALRHSLYHLGNGTIPATSAAAAAAVVTENTQMLNRTFLAHHHPQQQLFQAQGGRLPPFPVLHQLGPMRPHHQGAVVSGRYTIGSSNVPPSMPGQLTPVMGAAATAAAMAGRVRAPVPSSGGQDGVPGDFSATPLAYAQSHLQSGPPLPQRTHLPSQQVT